MMKQFTARVLCLLFVCAAWSCETPPPIPPDEPQAEPQPEESDEPDNSREEGEAEDDQPTYRDPQGRFSAPIPPDWKVDENEGFATAVGPDGKIKMHMAAVGPGDVVAAIEKMWPTVSPDLKLEATQTLNPPASDGLEDITVINYKMGQDAYVKQAIGWRAGDTVYLTLIEGELVPLQKRASQLNLIASGFQKSTMNQKNLAGVAPAKLKGDKKKLAAFEAHIEEMVELFGVPGTSIGVVQDGEVVYSKAFGERERDGEAMTTDTLMMIGSTSKTMTTMLMADVVDEGKMNWDTAAQKLLPEFSVKDPELSKKITIENLVCACTGVPRRDFEIFFNFNDLDGENVIESLETFEFFTDFGKGFQYSNQMVATGGYVTAAALGGEYGTLYDTYKDAMNERIFGPMGMKNTTLSFDEATGSGKAATPYATGLDATYQKTPLSIERFVIPLAPAGAVWSNTDDMTNYLITQLSKGKAPGGERVVSAENLMHTWEPQVEISALASYGLGWIVADYKGQRMISHGGNTTGFTSELAFLPEANLGITILSNAGSANDFSNSIRNRLFELAFELDPQAAKDAEFAKKTASEQLAKMRDRLQELDEKAVEPFVGNYTSDELGQITVSLANSKLVVDVGEFSSEVRPMVSEQTGELVYVTVDPPIIGAEMKLEELDGKKVITLGRGVESYTFVKGS
jgi:CubicO group peptidase (beta-lactamase class C family)